MGLDTLNLVQQPVKEKGDCELKPSSLRLKTLFGCLFVFLWHINLCRLFNAKSIFMKLVLFETIQFRISTQFKCKYSLIVKKTFLFQAIEFSQAVLIPLIHFSISTYLVYTDIKTVLY